MKNTLKLLLVLMLLADAPAAMAQYGFGTNTPASCAEVDITSTTLGFLPPRMSTTDISKISTPPDGLLVYDTSQGCLVYFTNKVAYPVYELPSSLPPAVASTGASSTIDSGINTSTAVTSYAYTPGSAPTSTEGTSAWKGSLDDGIVLSTTKPCPLLVKNQPVNFSTTPVDTSGKIEVILTGHEKTILAVSSTNNLHTTFDEVLL